MHGVATAERSNSRAESRRRHQDRGVPIDLEVIFCSRHRRASRRARSGARSCSWITEPVVPVFVLDAYEEQVIELANRRADIGFGCSGAPRISA